MATKKDQEAAKKRSAAAKKAAKTRARNAGNGEPQVDRGPKPPTEEEQTNGAQGNDDAAVEVEQRESPSYQPTHPPLENAGLDQHAAHEDREAERAAQRDAHNERVGDASR